MLRIHPPLKLDQVCEDLQSFQSFDRSSGPAAELESDRQGKQTVHKLLFPAQITFCKDKQKDRDKHKHRDKQNDREKHKHRDKSKKGDKTQTQTQM